MYTIQEEQAAGEEVEKLPEKSQRRSRLRQWTERMKVSPASMLTGVILCKGLPEVEDQK